MVNLPINQAETIFERFWDGGESYPTHQKFSPLINYKISYAPGTVAEVCQSWSAVDVSIQSQTDSGYSVRMERDCRLTVDGYDIFRMFASIAQNIDFRVSCRIDGMEQTIIETTGIGEMWEYEGPIHGKLITHITLEFRLKGSSPYTACLLWLGLSNSKRQAELESQKSPYTDEWEGCFQENAEKKPLLGLYFDEDGLEALRAKIKKEPFLSYMEKLRALAREGLSSEPEKEISEYIYIRANRWTRLRDRSRHDYRNVMVHLAFVGLVDNNKEMLHMACRILLSLAVTPKWTEGILGSCPGATWHHRSFTEESTCHACAMVLDWAGSLLTWHGKNMVYDAIIFKGVSRIEADFKTVDYIRRMNQGIVFSNGRIHALMALTRRYPRYESWLLDAEKDLREMVDAYVMDDGGTVEGPGYWNYTFSHVMPQIYLLSRYHGQNMKDYVWEKLRKTGDFALAMLSDEKSGTYFLPVNDAHSGSFHPLISACYSLITSDPRWQALYTKGLREESTTLMEELLILAPDLPPAEAEISPAGFVSLDTIGQTSLRQKTEDVGQIHLHLLGGPSYFSHSHADKGSFLLEVNQLPLLIDRGVCEYSIPYVKLIGESFNHNLFQPEAPEGSLSYSQDIMDHPGAKVVLSKWENGKLSYQTDTTGAWPDGIFHKITRSVISSDPHILVIRDDAEYVRATMSSFRLHTHGSITQDGNRWIISQGGLQVTVYPLNYHPCKVISGEYGMDQYTNPVNCLRLYVEKAMSHHIVTILEISRAGEASLQLLGDGTASYHGQTVDTGL